MKFDDVCIPITGAWSSPFIRWQGPVAEINSLELAHQVTERGLARQDVEWPFEELVLGTTIPQLHSFYGVPTLAARLGLGAISGPLVAQACATSVACLHVAAASQERREAPERTQERLGGAGVRTIVCLRVTE